MEPLVCRVRVMWCKVCVVRCLQFGQNLEELAHGVSPGHADILVLEHEEMAIPRPGLFLAHFNREKVGIVFIYCIPVGIYYAALQM